MVIVDEAQNLSLKVLEEVRLISGIETHKEKVLRIILAGQPELRDKIASPKLKQLTQRVRLRFHLGPLSKRELAEYIGHRISVAGGNPAEFFDDDAISEIYRYTQGVPRLTNTLCDTALLVAFADEKTAIDESIIKAAIEELDWREPHAVAVESPVAEIMSGDDTGNVIFGRVEILTNGEHVETHSLGPGRVIVGRTPDNDIRLASKFISRHHAQIVSTLNSCTLEDLNSTNGLFIDGKRIKKRVLKNGDNITIGKHELRYTDMRDATLDEVSGNQVASN